MFTVKQAVTFHLNEIHRDEGKKGMRRIAYIAVTVLLLTCDVSCVPWAWKKKKKKKKGGRGRYRGRARGRGREREREKRK